MGSLYIYHKKNDEIYGIVYEKLEDGHEKSKVVTYKKTQEENLSGFNIDYLNKFDEKIKKSTVAYIYSFDTGYYYEYLIKEGKIYEIFVTPSGEVVELIEKDLIIEGWDEENIYLFDNVVYNIKEDKIYKEHYNQVNVEDLRYIKIK